LGLSSSLSLNLRLCLGLSLGLCLCQTFRVGRLRLGASGQLGGQRLGLGARLVHGTLQGGDVGS